LKSYWLKGLMVLVLSAMYYHAEAADTVPSPSPDSESLALPVDAASGNVPPASPDAIPEEPAQVTPDIATQQNETALQAWQGSGPVPELVKNPDGSTRIEWKLNGSVARYNTEVHTDGDPRFNSQLRTGQQYKSVIQTDVRAVSPDGQVKYLQFNQTNSNDPSVISRSRSQITMMQAGWTGANYQTTLGDLIISQSTLGTTLPMRGLSGNIQFDKVSLGAFAGVVTESWEALDQKHLRYQLLRNVQGGKIGYDLLPSLNVYGTWQQFSDVDGSAPDAPYTPSASDANASTLGFRWQLEKFNLTGEVANSNFSDDAGSDYNGKAAILDATYQFPTVSLRSGYHYIEPDYKSLSYSVIPGVNERYVGGDWTASEWLVLGLDLRSSENTTLSQPFFPSQTSKSNSVTGRADINFGNKIPGLGLSLQHTEANGKDGGDFSNHNTNSSAVLMYYTATWNASGSWGYQRTTNKAYSSGDSTINSLQLNAGKTFTYLGAGQTPIWTFGVNLALTAQLQELDTGGDTLNSSYSIRASADHAKGTKINLYWLRGRLTQPTSGPALRQKTWEVDASHPIFGQHAIKLFAREYRRNLGVQSLATTERIGGAEFAYNF
jgi:hypothetical protein